MSRFYDALKHADLSFSRPDRDHLTEERKVPTISESLVLPSLISEPESSAPSQVATAVLTTPEPESTPKPDAWVISADLERKVPRFTQQNGTASTSSARIAIDQNVRAIPNAAHSVVVEHYRRLRTKLMQEHASKAFRSLMVTSPGPSEGKTVTALNLALSFAMLPSFKVLLVDGDLRRGSLGKWLGLQDHPGLSNLVDGSCSLSDVIIKSEDLPIQCIASGNSQMSAAELLHSPQLDGHFRSLTEQFDLVLVDSPPVNVITDAQLLAAHCHAVLLVARAFITTRKELEKASQDLAPFRVVGTVLNGGSRAHLYRRYSGYY